MKTVHGIMFLNLVLEKVWKMVFENVWEP